MGLRSLVVVASICAGISIAHAGVVIDLSRLDCETAPARAAIEQALVMRLVQEGFAIDPVTGEQSIVVAITGCARELVLSATSASFARTRTVALGAGSGAELQLEIVQKLVELARLAREATPPPDEPPAPVAAPPAPPTVVAFAPPVALRAHVDGAAVSVRRESSVQEPARPAPWQLGADLGLVVGYGLEASLHARYRIAESFSVGPRITHARRGSRSTSACSPACAGTTSPPSLALRSSRPVRATTLRPRSRRGFHCVHRARSSSLYGA